MARSDPFDGISEFLAVADRASFRKAAAELGVTPAAVSQAIRTLEAKLGLLLFQRTTRHVGLTEAGATLLVRLRPAAAEIGEAFDALASLRDRPSGLLRLSVPRMALALVIEPLLPEFRRLYPDVSLEIDVQDRTVDLTLEGFDAGIRLGQFLERDMVAVRASPDVRWCVLGSPGYFAAHGRPETPEDLSRHESIRYRYPRNRQLYRWEFLRDGQTFTIEPRSGLMVNDGALMRSLAVRGLGLIYSAHLSVERELTEGTLEAVLQPYLPASPGLFLYFPARNQTQPKLRAFIDLMAERLRVRQAELTPR